MEITELRYPVFEANQVLSNSHLNDMFEYLDEQSRLTRADLIGIGIVCGLGVAPDADGIRLTRGCGVTSQGYLIVEPDDLLLTHVRTYALPFEVGYRPFMVPGSDPAQQYPLWELFPDDDEPGSGPLATSELPLDRMAVVLFLELRQDRSRTCSPKGCDDRGSQVSATVRRLLIQADDLRAIIEAGRADGPAPVGVDPEKRLGLPDLRMPRFDVPNTSPVSAEKVLAGFQAAFRKNGLATATAEALTALYRAFEPLVAPDHPAGDPFATFATRFAFLDGTPVTVDQVLFMQYYWDFFADLLAGYDEVRAKGVDLLAACSPPQGLFPRHLAAGVLGPADPDGFEYRSRFVPSPAVSDRAERGAEVRMLFRRLAAMVSAFTEAPGDDGIKATPSRSAAPLSARAIPYYYRQDDTPRLYEVWNPRRTRERRADRNFGYRAREYVPAAPVFVTDPLRFELEPNDFLRIEGHLGIDVQAALKSLLALRRRYRLPIDVIALRTGLFDENMTVDLTQERCRFQDLESLYETLKSELRCFLVKQVQYFYRLPLPGSDLEGLPPLTPTLPILVTQAPDFVVRPGTIGYGIEAMRQWAPGRPLLFQFMIGRIPHLPSHAMALTAAMSDLARLLTDDLRDLDFARFDERYAAIVTIAETMDQARRDGIYDQPGLADRLDDIVYRCRRDPFDALAEQYRQRLRDAKQQQFLSTFLERHPGVQHRAGVPLGGTFILVYHGGPASTVGPNRQVGPRDEAGSVLERLARRRADDGAEEAAAAAFEGLTANRLWSAVSGLRDKVGLLADPDVRTIAQLIPALVPQLRLPPGDATERIYRDAVAGLTDGTVIADFYLPYGCRSDCPPIQYLLPPTRLRLATSKSCTNAGGVADVTLTAEGAVGQLSIQVDHGPFAELVNPVPLGVGRHTLVVRDSTGNESSPVELSVPAQLVIGEPGVELDGAADTYRVRFVVAGGTPPYLADVGVIAGTAYTSPDVKLAESISVTVTDAAGCAVTASFDSGQQPCEFPCDGVAVRQGHRFWLPEARPELPINGWDVDVRVFAVAAPDGAGYDLTDRVRDIIKGPATIPSNAFEKLVRKWLKGIEAAVAEVLGTPDWFRFDYAAATEDETTGTLFVDRMQCASLTFELAVTFSQGKRRYRRDLVYFDDGTIVADVDSDAKFRIPPYSVTTSNRCRPDDPAVPRCEGTDLVPRILRDGTVPGPVTFIAAVPDGDVPVAFLWEVPDAVPPESGGEKFEVREFAPVEPTVKLVRLTAFTEKGCSVTVQDRFDVAKR